MFLIPDYVIYQGHDPSIIKFTIISQYGIVMSKDTKVWYNNKKETDQYKNIIQIQNKYREFLELQGTEKFQKIYEKFNKDHYKNKYKKTYENIQDVKIKLNSLNNILKNQIKENTEFKDENQQYNQIFIFMRISSNIKLVNETLAANTKTQLKHMQSPPQLLQNASNEDKTEYIKEYISTYFCDFCIQQNLINQERAIEICKQYQKSPIQCLSQIMEEEQYFKNFTSSEKIIYQIMVFNYYQIDPVINLNDQQASDNIIKICKNLKKWERRNYSEEEYTNNKNTWQLNSKFKENLKENTVLKTTEDKLSEYKKEIDKAIEEIKEEEDANFSFKMFCGIFIFGIILGPSLLIYARIRKKKSTTGCFK